MEFSSRQHFSRETTPNFPNTNTVQRAPLQEARDCVITELCGNRRGGGLRVQRASPPPCLPLREVTGTTLRLPRPATRGSGGVRGGGGPAAVSGGHQRRPLHLPPAGSPPLTPADPACGQSIPPTTEAAPATEPGRAVADPGEALTRGWGEEFGELGWLLATTLFNVRS